MCHFFVEIVVFCELFSIEDVFGHVFDSLVGLFFTGFNIFAIFDIETLLQALGGEGFLKHFVEIKQIKLDLYFSWVLAIKIFPQFISNLIIFIRVRKIRIFELQLGQKKMILIQQSFLTFLQILTDLDCKLHPLDCQLNLADLAHTDGRIDQYINKSLIKTVLLSDTETNFVHFESFLVLLVFVQIVGVDEGCGCVLQGSVISFYELDVFFVQFLGGLVQFLLFCDLDEREEGGAGTGHYLFHLVVAKDCLFCGEV